MLVSNRLCVRLMEIQDLEKARLLHNEESTLNRLSDPFHVSQEEQVEWFRNLSKSRKQRRYVILNRENDELVGVIRVDQIDLVNRSCEIGADVLPSMRRQGVASEAYGLIINYLFNTMGIHRLQLLTLVSNRAAINLYEKLGFKREGILRESIARDGNFIDLILMSLLSQEWKMLE